ncbi:hypothetical protein FKP32DRAFT_1681793 [Trametes sanguinea]|nr:hypothetical protein FKP32DRAFT_1681793 [Trametes sanguinea]
MGSNVGVGGTVELNNYLQERRMLALLHWEDKQDGPRHEVTWTSQCKIHGEVLGTGKGSKLTAARDAAANAALAVLRARNGDTEVEGDAGAAVSEPET